MFFLVALIHGHVAATAHQAKTVEASIQRCIHVPGCIKAINEPDLQDQAKQSFSITRSLFDCRRPSRTIRHCLKLRFVSTRQTRCCLSSRCYRSTCSFSARLLFTCSIWAPTRSSRGTSVFDLLATPRLRRSRPVRKLLPYQSA